MPYLLFNGSSSSWLQFSQKIVNLSLAVRSLSPSLYTWGFSCAQQVRALVLIEAKTHFKAIWLAVVSSEQNNTNHSKQTPLLVSDEWYAIAKDAICSQFTLVVSSTKWLALLLLLSRFAKVILNPLRNIRTTEFENHPMKSSTVTNVLRSKNGVRNVK